MPVISEAALHTLSAPRSLPQQHQHPPTAMSPLHPSPAVVPPEADYSKTNVTVDMNSYAYYGCSPTSVFYDMFLNSAPSSTSTPSNASAGSSGIQMIHYVSASSMDMDETSSDSEDDSQNSQKSFLPNLILSDESEDLGHDCQSDDEHDDADGDYGFYVNIEESPRDPVLVLRGDVASGQYETPPGLEHSQIISRTEQIRKRQYSQAQTSSATITAKPPRRRFQMLHML